MIPTYNRSASLCVAVDSVLEQTYRNLEVVIIDDASTDDTAVRLRSYPSVLYFKTSENRGPNFCRNMGAMVATGEYLAFLDSDDIWYPEKLERQMSLFLEDSTVVFAGTRSYWCRDGLRNLSPVQPIGSVAETIYGGNFVGGFSSLMVRTKAFMDAGMTDVGLQSCQDWDLYIRLAKLGMYGCVQEPLFEYNLHGQNIRDDEAKIWSGRQRLFDKIEKDFPVVKWRERYRLLLALDHPGYGRDKRIAMLQALRKTDPFNVKVLIYLLRLKARRRGSAVGADSLRRS